MKEPINLPEAAVRKINDILNRGKNVELTVRGGKLIIWSTSDKKEYEAVMLR